MSERGVFAVDRGIWDDPDFAPEPFTEREAFMWLVGEAAWRKHRRRLGGHVYDLDRGQLVCSLRFLAEAWQWGKGSVERFLAMLAQKSIIGTLSGHSATVITIRNYSRFQRVSLPEANECGTEAGQTRDKVEDIESKEDTTPPTGAPRDLDWVRSKLLSVGGVALSETATLVLSEPLRWLREGCDLDADVLPVIAARCRGQPRDRFKNLSYFSAAVFEARDRRLSPAPIREPRHAEHQPRKSTVHDRIGAILGRQSGGGDHEDGGRYSNPTSGPIIDALAERLPHHAGQGAEIIAIGAPRR